MKSERVTRTWEFCRDNCPGFKEPMRKEFRKLDEYVSIVESDNAKLRELVKNLHACNGSCPRCIELMGRCEYKEQLGELGIEVEDV